MALPTDDITFDDNARTEPSLEDVADSTPRWMKILVVACLIAGLAVCGVEAYVWSQLTSNESLLTHTLTGMALGTVMALTFVSFTFLLPFPLMRLVPLKFDS